MLAGKIQHRLYTQPISFNITTQFTLNIKYQKFQSFSSQIPSIDLDVASTLQSSENFDDPINQTEQDVFKFFITWKISHRSVN